MDEAQHESSEFYEALHGAVVDALKYMSVGQSAEEAADEVLARLRTAGLPIPDK
ncbi:hypothetical protein [Leifsonia shinshuensis]|uniref:hypothetical protein n=1 Tax=Leifsonia shinshuensis TaxID=150026 RepID=UPI00285FE0DA|nr:hypothetical protein [Leifsonia shinshuensis]MDR6969750.1 hypothetical protein [Leifsonia shinshuensis]